MKWIYILVYVLLTACTASQQKTTIERVNVFKNPNVPPKGCSVWFDGCNKCSVQKQRILGCTKMACFKYKPKKCIKFETGPKPNEIKRKKCIANKGIWQRKVSGTWVCLQHTADHNQPCNTSADCDGLCMYYPNKTRGYCSRYTPFVGCAHEYENGKHFEVCE